MEKNAMEYLVSLGQVETIKIGDRTYSTKELKLVEEVKDKLPNNIKNATLTGLVDYIKANVDAIKETLLIQVESFDSVKVSSPLNKDMNRAVYIAAKAETPQITFDYFIDTEKFNIMLQSCFLDNPDKANILKVIGNIKEENVKTTGDDGVSQSVTAKVGIAKVDNVIIPNPVTLVPFMTFTEIEQPEIKYVFRMKDGPSASLFEADGGAWKLRTMLKIKEYLQEELKDYNVKIIS